MGYPGLYASPFWKSKHSDSSGCFALWWSQVINKQVDPFYKSAKWKRKRQSILRRDKYQCQASRRFGRIVQADTVHHILPRDQYPQYELCDWNLISLSSKEHNKMHDRITNELTPEGRRLANDILRKRKIQNHKWSQLTPPPILLEP